MTNELIIDVLSQSTIELTKEELHHSNPCVLHVRKTRSCIVHMLESCILSARRAHLEAWARSAAKEDVQLFHKLTPNHCGSRARGPERRLGCHQSIANVQKVQGRI